MIAILQHAAGGSLPKVQALVEKNPALVNAANYEGETPLHRAVHGYGSNQPNKELVRFLLSRGASVKARGQYVAPPLHEVRDAAIVRLLLDAGAEPDCKDHFGRTALDMARWSGAREVYELLISRGATITVADAALLGRTKELAQMLDAKPKLVNEIDALGMAPLHYAARSNQMAVAKLLLDRGADPNIRTRPSGGGFIIREFRGSTPIEFAKDKDHTEMVRLLESKSK